LARQRGEREREGGGGGEQEREERAAGRGSQGSGLREGISEKCLGGLL